jgi:hypothetical protein
MLTKLFYLLLRGTFAPLAHIEKKKPSMHTPLRICGHRRRHRRSHACRLTPLYFAASVSPPQPSLPLSLSPDVAQSVATSACCARLAQWCPNHAAQTPSGVAACPHRALCSSAPLCLVALSTRSTARREIRWWWGLRRRLQGLRGVACRAHDTNSHEGVSAAS